MIQLDLFDQPVPPANASVTRRAAAASIRSDDHET